MPNKKFDFLLKLVAKLSQKESGKLVPLGGYKERQTDRDKIVDLRRNSTVGPVDRPLKLSPETLNRVSMNFTSNVLF